MPATLVTRRITAVVTGGALFAISPLAVQAAVASPAEPEIGAAGASLIDATNDTTLFGHNADTALPLASTTKIMTAVVVLDDADLDLEQEVTVEQEYRDYVEEEGASTADLQTGDRVTVEQLLYAALLPSGADAALALADTFGSGETSAARTASFVEEMNDKAEELDLESTAFETFDGLGADSSTPVELAELARYALENETFREIVETEQYQGEAPAENGGTRYYTWNNTNQLLGSYDGVIGIKTGTTTAAGPCLVFAAERDGTTLVGTVMNSAERYEEAAALLDYGFGADSASELQLRQLPTGAQQD